MADNKAQLTWQNASGVASSLVHYLSTLASSTLIILFLEMLKMSKNISSNSKNIVKENSEYLIY
jgi:hypothetical protein